MRERWNYEVEADEERATKRWTRLRIFPKRGKEEKDVSEGRGKERRWKCKCKWKADDV